MLTEDMRNMASNLRLHAVEGTKPSSLGLAAMAEIIDDWARTLEDMPVITGANVVPFKPRVISTGGDK